MKTLPAKSFLLAAVSLFLVGFGPGYCSAPTSGPDFLTLQGGSQYPNQKYGAFSTMDNPIIRAKLTLTGNQYGEMGPLGITWHHVNPTLVELAAPDGQPNYGRVEATLPPAPGADPKALVEVHGTQLGYRPLLLQGNTQHMSDDNSTSVNDTYMPAPFPVRLAPNVLLVPMQVVRVLGAPGAIPADKPYLADLAKYTAASWRAVWDDAQTYTINRNSSPDDFYDWTRYTLPAFDAVLPIPSGFTALAGRPDDIWNVAGIQVRMIDCNPDHPGGGCPDVFVEDWKQIQVTSCTRGGVGATDYPEARHNVSLAQQLPGVNRDLPLQVVTWSVAQDCVGGTPIDLAKLGGPWMVISMRAPSPYVIAHEFGHILGLDDIQDCLEKPYDGHCCDLKHPRLMCTNGALQGPYLSDQEIEQARVIAKAYSEAYFGKNNRSFP